MLSPKRQPTISSTVFALLVGAVLLPIGGCQDVSTEPRSGVDLTPIKAMAAATDCADGSNRLFLIDDQSVFWDRRGDCVDRLYSFTLFGSTVDDILCERHDAVGGGNVTKCSDESYRDMFSTIITNLDDPALGLGSEHRVQQVPF